MNIDQSCDVIRVLTEADWIFISWKLNTAICSLLTTVAVAWQQQTERTYRKCCRPTDGLHDASWWLWSELQLLTIQQPFYLTVSHKWSFVSVQQHFSFPPREQEGFTRVILFSFTLKCCCWGSQREQILETDFFVGETMTSHLDLLMPSVAFCKEQLHLIVCHINESAFGFSFSSAPRAVCDKGVKSKGRKCVSNNEVN